MNEKQLYRPNIGDYVAVSLQTDAREPHRNWAIMSVRVDSIGADCVYGADCGQAQIRRDGRVKRIGPPPETLVAVGASTCVRVQLDTICGEWNRALDALHVFADEIADKYTETLPKRTVEVNMWLANRGYAPADVAPTDPPRATMLFDDLERLICAHGD